MCLLNNQYLNNIWNNIQCRTLFLIIQLKKLKNTKTAVQLNTVVIRYMYDENETPEINQMFTSFVQQVAAKDCIFISVCHDSLRISNTIYFLD